MFRQLLNQMLFAAKSWQRAVIAVTVAGAGPVMILAGIVLGHYDMSLAGVLILAVTGRIILAMLRARRAAKSASR